MERSFFEIWIFVHSFVQFLPMRGTGTQSENQSFVEKGRSIFTALWAKWGCERIETQLDVHISQWITDVEI